VEEWISVRRRQEDFASLVIVFADPEFQDFLQHCLAGN